MSKKLIAIMIAATLVFIGVFAACEKEEEDVIYIDNDKYPFVTDENGEKILDENGEYVVFATDENGKYKTDDSGNRVTQPIPFEPYSEDTYVEDYFYRINLPEGWVIDKNEKNTFLKEETGERVSITLYKDTYRDAYESNYGTYIDLNSNEELKKEGVTVTWEEGVKNFNAECEGVVRFCMTSKGELTNVLYIFRNNGNIYKVLFEMKTDIEEAKSESMEFFDSIVYKPFKYHEPVTDKEGNTVHDPIVTGGEITTAPASTVPSTTAAAE